MISFRQQTFAIRSMLKLGLSLVLMLGFAGHARAIAYLSCHSPGGSGTDVFADTPTGTFPSDKPVGTVVWQAPVRMTQVTCRYTRAVDLATIAPAPFVFYQISGMSNAGGTISTSYPFLQAGFIVNGTTTSWSGENFYGVSPLPFQIARLCPDALLQVRPHLIVRRLHLVCRRRLLRDM